MQEALGYAIQRCCELKAEVVADDERESGRRAILNFGHTFAHAIERCQGYGEWLHGEAVAAGMIMAARLSNMESAEFERLAGLVERAGLPVVPPTIAADAMRSAMGMDKKVRDNKLRFVLLRALGDAYVTTAYDNDLLDNILQATE